MQAAHKDYAFHTLGWYQFEKLCHTILVDILGQTVQVFSSGNDGGRDAAFSGTWKQQGGEDLSGTFTFQVKYSSKANMPLVYSDLKPEVEKACALTDDGLCDNYIIITNHVVTGVRASELEISLKAATGAQHVRIFGINWLSDRITTSSYLRMLVPRVYGLGDISEMLSAPAYEQAKAILSWMPELKTIVTTKAMQRAARMLRNRRFVLMTGDAMVGKTTAACSLALAALDEMKLRVVKVRSAEEFATHWNANPNSDQFFWVDDAFGDTVYDDTLTRAWGRHLDALGAAIELGACVIMTSRSYIWTRAQDTIKTYAFDRLFTDKVVIRLEDLSITERSEMLYNHLRIGRQSQPFKASIAPLLPNIAQIQPFYPEAARRLADPNYTAMLQSDLAAVEDFFRNPQSILIDIFTRLGAADIAVLALTFTKGGELRLPLEFDSQALDVIDRFGAQRHDVAAAANAMRDVFLREVLDFDGSTAYRFAHPSFSDAMAEMTARRPDMLDIYLAGADPITILRKTHAGKPGEKGVEIAVPPSRYDVIIAAIRILASRFPGVGPANWSFYLIRRSGAPFLKLALERIPDVFEPTYYYIDEWDPEWDEFLQLCLALKVHGLLSDELQRKVAKRLERYLSSDLKFFDSTLVKELVAVSDRDRLLSALEQNPERNLETMLDRYHDAISSDDDVDDFYAGAFDYMRTLLELFPNNVRVRTAYDAAMYSLESRIDDHRAAQDERAQRSERNFSFASVGPGSDVARAMMSRNVSGDEARPAIPRNIFSDVAEPN